MLRSASVVLCSLLALTAVITYAASRANVRVLVGVSAVILTAVAAAEGTAFMVRSPATFSAPARFDRRVRTRFGKSFRWSAAGAPFITGFLIQLAGTLVG
jgi:hypothetical protein